MQGRGVIKPPLGITFDSDFGNTIDSVLTLGFLRALAAKGEIRVISVSITKANLKAAQAEEAITNFYAGGPIGGGTGFGGGPDKVGLATDGKMADDTPILNAVLSRKTADGKTAYSVQIGRILDTAESPVTMRNMLLAQNDENAAVLLVGPAGNVVKLMELYGAKPQITAKVKYLVVAAGAFPNGAADFNVRTDISSARKLFAEWPTPVIAVGTEVGEALRYPGTSIDKDFTWATAHPIVDAYKAYKSGTYDATVPGMAAALYAAHPDDGYFKLSEPGTITVLDDGRTKFTPGAGGRHRYLIVDPAQKEKVVNMYTELVSAKPAPRAPGGRGGRGGSGAGGRGASGGRGVLPPAAAVPAEADLPVAQPK
jgi:inosine-uridine nucleoside N-ribohydrolase